MRAELPWNVAGIPPEAREAARAAARREGLSVGEWLTRRILRSFSGMEDDTMPLERASFAPGLDAWGLPQSAASRRETEDMLARVGRSESESSDAYRRIEEQMKGVARRLDTSERSHSESNRVLSRTTQEMNIAAREQAQAFDQMSVNVMTLNERLERVERNAANDGIKDAVKGLHQGLSRLADQITQTANQSATQISQLATSLEQLATRVSKSRVDAEEADKQLAQRIMTVENVGHNNANQLQDRLVGLENGAHAGLMQLEQRLASLQDGGTSSVAALEQKLQAAQASAQSSTHALEMRLAALQDGAQTNNVALEQRLAAIQGNAQASASALEQRLATLQDNTQVSTGALEQRLAALQDSAQTGNAALDQRLSALQDTVQVSSAALEQRVAASQEEARAARAALEQRVASLQDNVQASHALLEQRLAATERTAQFHTNAIDHALEKIDAAATTRAGELSEGQRRIAQIEEAFRRLDESVARLESRGTDVAMERRLDGIERGLGGLVDRLETYNPAAPLEDSLKTLSQRMETLEKDHDDLLAELRANLMRNPEPPSAFAPPPQDFRHPQGSFAAVEPPAPQPEAFEAPPFADSAAHAGFGQNAFHQPFHDAPADDYAAFGQDGADPFAPALGFEPPPEVGADPFAVQEEYGSSYTEAAGDSGENFLSQARRTARAAADKVENDRSTRGNFRWNNAAAEATPAAAVAGGRSKYLIPVICVVVAVLAVAAGLVLSQRVRRPEPPAQVASATVPVPALPVPLPAAPPAGNQAPFVVAPPAGPSADQAKPKSTRLAPPLEARSVKPAPIKPVSDATPIAPPAKVAPVSADRVTQLANANNPTAETVLGLRALDGSNGAPANLTEGVRWLTAAANQGQAVAQYRLGTLYERGQGVTADPAKAAHWYELAANQGNRKAMHNLAVADASGASGRKNMSEAARWFAKAAALGLSDSQFNLAVLYERGDGVPQSLLDAYKWYSIAAAAGDAESRARIAVLQTQLSDSDRAAAQKSAATFHAAALNRSANVPPEAADLG